MYSVERDSNACCVCVSVRHYRLISDFLGERGRDGERDGVGGGGGGEAHLEICHNAATVGLCLLEEDLRPWEKQHQVSSPCRSLSPLPHPRLVRPQAVRIWLVMKSILDLPIPRRSSQSASTYMTAAAQTWPEKKKTETPGPCKKSFGPG